MNLSPITAIEALYMREPALTIALGVLVGLLVVLVILHCVAVQRSRLGSEALASQLTIMREVLDVRQGDMSRTMLERMDHLSHRLGQGLLDSTRYTSETLQKMHERLGIIDEAQKSIGQLSKNVTNLRDIFINKQARGAFGQGRMESIITDALPEGTFTFQATLSSGKRPDCLIHMPHGAPSLAIDAKFPLEALAAWEEAGDDEGLRKQALSRLKGDVSRHIQDIAEKYLIPGETQDVALLFVPSEAVFADLHAQCADVIQKGFRARVVMVSPTLLLLGVEIIRHMLRDERMREDVTRVQREVGLLAQDVQQIFDKVGALGKHMRLADEDVTKIMSLSERAAKRAEKVQNFEAE